MQSKDHFLNVWPLHVSQLSLVALGPQQMVTLDELELFRAHKNPALFVTLLHYMYIKVEVIIIAMTTDTHCTHTVQYWVSGGLKFGD